LLFIESSPGSGGIYLEILTYWLKELDRP
jgi:hypothetical protein